MICLAFASDLIRTPPTLSPYDRVLNEEIDAGDLRRELDHLLRRHDESRDENDALAAFVHGERLADPTLSHLAEETTLKRHWLIVNELVVCLVRAQLPVPLYDPVKFDPPPPVPPPITYALKFSGVPAWSEF